MLVLDVLRIKFKHVNQILKRHRATAVWPEECQLLHLDYECMLSFCTCSRNVAWHQTGVVSRLFYHVWFCALACKLNIALFVVWVLRRMCVPEGA